MTTDVSKPHGAYIEMAESWELPDTLKGGTHEMREAGKMFLPQEPRESLAAYKVRLNRSFLFNGYASTLEMLSAKPFQKEVIVNGDISDDFKSLLDNIDLGGSNISKFGHAVFEDAMNYGLTHILVDMPSRDTNINIDKQSQKENNIRPYMVSVSAKSLINWTSEFRNGVNVLTSVTIKSSKWVNVGNTQKLKFIYTVISEDEINVYEAEKDNSKPVLAEGYPKENTLGKVPLVTHYSNKTGFMTGKPPMLDLAYTNLNHWQSSSDQRNILRIARVPFLLATGFSSGSDSFDENGNPVKGTSELDSVVTISPNSLAFSANDKANLRFIEHGGAGIEAGERDLAMLKEEMAIQGATFILPKKGASTATEYKGNSGSIQSKLQAITVCFQDALNTSVKLLADWLDIDTPDFMLEVHKDFNASLEDKASTDLLLKSRQAGQISQETLLSEFKRRNILADSFDIDLEVELTKEEDAGLSALMPSSPTFNG